MCVRLFLSIKYLRMVIYDQTNSAAHPVDGTEVPLAAQERPAQMPQDGELLKIQG